MIRDVVLAVAFLVLAGNAFSRAQVGQEPDVQVTMAGRGRAIDGNTLAIGTVVFRLEGIAAPHLSQTCKLPDGNLWHCGIAAKKHLGRLIAGRNVVCYLNGKHPHGRIIAMCYSGARFNIGSRMVLDGYAMTREKDGPDVAFQRYARVRHLGIWASSFTVPWRWHPNAI